MDMVVATNLTKSYSDMSLGDFYAVKNISFHAAAGEIFGVLGPMVRGRPPRCESSVLSSNQPVVRQS